MIRMEWKFTCLDAQCLDENDENKETFDEYNNIRTLDWGMIQVLYLYALNACRITLP